MDVLKLEESFIFLTLSMQRIKEKFKALSFKSKLMILFTTNTLVTFIIFNLIFQLIMINNIHNNDLTESTLIFSRSSNN